MDDVNVFWASVGCVAVFAGTYGIVCAAPVVRDKLFAFLERRGRGRDGDESDGADDS